MTSGNSFASINFNDPNSSTIFEKHSNEMCASYKKSNGNDFSFNVKLLKKKNEKNAYIVTGSLEYPNFTQKYFVKYNASSPPDYNANFSGSALPFPNEEVAFENTPNRGVAQVTNGDFSFVLKYPNSYYTNMGTVYIPPQVRMVLVDKDNKELSSILTLNLGQGVPFRTLTWPNQRNWNNGAMFYDNQDLPVRTQYQILLDNAYPSTNVIPKNFWGMKFSN
jgi:hypothetical protein